MPINDPADNFAVQYDPITNAPIVNNEILDLEVEKDVLTDTQITTLLAKYSNSRALLFLYDARERLLKEGQENWNGDKKSFEIRFDFLTKEIARLEKVVQQELVAKTTGGQPNCPITICRVSYE